MIVMSSSINPISFSKGVLAALTMMLTALLGSVFLMGPVLPLMAVRPKLFRWINDNLMGLWLLLPVAVLEIIFGVTIATSGDRIQSDEGSVIIMNHRTRLDWMFFWVVVSRQSDLRTEKIILKNDPKMCPGFGWAMQMACYIFLNRRWETDRPLLVQLLHYFGILQYKGQFLIFPEGTNLDCKTKLSSDRFAEKNNLPNYQYCLHPRTTGFVFLMQELRKNNLLDTVYDVTVTYPDFIPEHGELNMIAGSFPSRVNFHIRRHAQSALPRVNDGLESWCLDRWREKETALGSFYTGDKDHLPLPGDGEGDSATAATEQSSDRRVLCAALLFWCLFVVATLSLLWWSVVARWFFVITASFYTYHSLLRGGMEQLIMRSCRWYYGHDGKSS